MTASAALFDIRPPQLPLLLEPASVVGADALGQWLELHRNWVALRLTECGALLFRGFGGVGAAQRLAQVLPEFSGTIIAFTGDARQWDRSPLVDLRAVYRALDPALRERWERRGLLIAGEGAEPTPHWPARSHLAGNEPVWFNPVHELHADALQLSWWQLYSRRATRRHFLGWAGSKARSTWARLRGRPEPVTHADGSPIPATEVAAVIRAVWHSMSIVSWQQGDVLVYDPELIARVRLPYAAALDEPAAAAEPQKWKPLSAVSVVPVT